MPAYAGIQSPGVPLLDSRLRGNDASRRVGLQPDKAAFFLLLAPGTLLGTRHTLEDVAKLMPSRNRGKFPH